MPPDFHSMRIAIPAVLLVGFSKGGMGEALSLMGVPLLSLAVSPVQAAALLLPILIAMDWWRSGHGASMATWTTLKILLPGALIGIAIGWATSAYVPRDALRLIIGAMTVLFVLRYVYNLWPGRGGARHAGQAAAAGARDIFRRPLPAMAASSPMPAARRSRSIPCR